MLLAFALLPLLIFLAIFVMAVIRFVRGPKYSAGEGLQLIGGVPATPSLPGTAYLFPGRGTPPDPDVRETPTTLVDRRPSAPLPPGIRRIED
jgi:hypothetical protein